MGLFGELKRRNVFRVTAAYLVFAWLLLQARRRSVTVEKELPSLAVAVDAVGAKPGDWVICVGSSAAREAAGGRIDYVVSHAGERAFSRSFQALSEGGVLTFYGASSGYRFSFVGKSGTRDVQGIRDDPGIPLRHVLRQRLQPRLLPINR